MTDWCHGQEREKQRDLSGLALLALCTNTERSCSGQSLADATDRKALLCKVKELQGLTSGLSWQVYLGWKLLFHFWCCLRLTRKSRECHFGYFIVQTFSTGRQSSVDYLYAHWRFVFWHDFDQQRLNFRPTWLLSASGSKNLSHSSDKPCMPKWASELPLSVPARIGPFCYQ